MSGSDNKLEALFNEAVAGQQRLETKATGEDSVETLVIEDEDAAAEEDSVEIVVPADDELDTASDGTQEKPPVQVAQPPPAKPAPAPKKTAQDVVTEALIKAKQEALEILEQTQKEAKSLQDRLMRVSADFDNFRKRSSKQQEDAAKYANENLLRELLPVIDNFDRALEHVAEDTDDPMTQGVKMVHLHLIATLEKLNCKGFSALGTVFDPERHEAVEQQATDEVPAGSVVREYQKGYLLADRLLRPAMVVVATPVTPPPVAARDTKGEAEVDSEASVVAASESDATTEDQAKADPASAKEPGAAETPLEKTEETAETTEPIDDDTSNA